MDSLAGVGIKSILVNLHHHADQVKRFVEQRTDRTNITLVSEKTLLGTAGTVRANAQFCGDMPTMVIHADNLCTSDLTEFIRAHRARPKGAEITMMSFRTDDPKECGIVEINAQGIVTSFHEKTADPPGNLANGAVYIFEESVIRWISSRDEKILDISTNVLPEFIGRIFAWPADGVHIDIGNLENLVKANTHFLG